MRKRHIVLGSVVASLAMSASTFAVEVCRPAETLRTETCSVTSNGYCKAAGYTATGSKRTDIITYGQLVTPGRHEIGDSYICDVNGDDEFDIDNERFYYLASYGDYASLLWSKYYTTNKYSSSNVFYPGNASNNLPNATIWSNVALQVNPRMVARTDSTETNSYNYTNVSSRLLSLRDLEIGLPNNVYANVLSENADSLDNYAFLFDGTRFAGDSGKAISYWMEEVTAYGGSTGTGTLTCTNSYSQNCGKSISSQSRGSDHRQWSDNYAYKPVIEVPNDKIGEDYHEYTISYELDGGSVDGENPTGYKFMDSYTLINPTKQGYVFQGWATDAEGTDTTNPLTIPVGSSGDKKYYAIFTPATNTAYTVHHRKQLASGAYDATDTDTDDLTGTTGAKVTPDRKSYDGYDSPAGVEIEILADGSADLVYYYDLKNLYD